MEGFGLQKQVFFFLRAISVVGEAAETIRR